MRFLNGWLVLFVFVFLLSCSSQSKNSHKSAEIISGKDILNQILPMDSNIVKGQFENGLTYYIRKNTTPENRAELRLVINAGSILEDDDQQGLAHFCEHMAFNGTKNFEKQALVDYLESIGMRFGPEINAYTGFDQTVYMLTVPTDSLEVLEKAFQVLEDWANYVTFEDEEIDKERGVIIEEWRLGRGAEARMRDKQFPILFKGSQYAQRLPIGKKEILENFSYETLRRFYRDWYRPDLTAIIAVGDFNVEYIKGLISKHFEKHPVKENLRPRENFPVPEHEETLFAIASDPEARMSSVSIYHKLPVPIEETIGDYRRSLVEQLYNRMLDQRLSELSQQADPPFLFAGSGKGRFVRSGEIYYLNAVVKDNGISRGFEAILRETQRVKLYGFTETELERQKLSMLRSMERLYNERDKFESENFADELVRNYLENEPAPGIEKEYELFQTLIPGITLDEVNQLASEWNVPANRVVLVNSPQKEGIKIPNEDDLRSIIDQIKAEKIEPYIETKLVDNLIENLPEPIPIEEEKYIDEIGVFEWKLSNGIKVILKPTDFKNDEILMKAFSPGGYSLAADSNLIAAKMAEDIIQQSGVSQFSRIELQKMLADKLVNVSPTINELSEGFTGRVSPQDMEILFQLIYLYFYAPRIDSSAYLSLLVKMTGFLQNRGASPEVVVSDTLTVTLFNHNPRYKPWSMESLQEMDLGKSVEFYKDRFADGSDFVFLFVGNFKVDQIKPLVESYLATLPVLNRQEKWGEDTYDHPEGVIKKIVYKGQESKSVNYLVFTGAFEWSLDNRYRAEAMLDVLRILLRERIREDLGGTYGVRINGEFSRYPRQRYRIRINFGADPERVEELSGEIFEEIKNLQKFGPSTENLTKIKEMHRREHELNLKENSYWLNALYTRYWNNLDPVGILKAVEKIESLTAKDIQEAAQMYLNLDNYILAVLLPEKVEGGN